MHTTAVLPVRTRYGERDSFHYRQWGGGGELEHNSQVRTTHTQFFYFSSP